MARKKEKEFNPTDFTDIELDKLRQKWMDQITAYIANLYIMPNHQVDKKYYEGTGELIEDLNKVVQIDIIRNSFGKMGTTIDEYRAAILKSNLN